jgi:hypothetical protein
MMDMKKDKGQPLSGPWHMRSEKLVFLKMWLEECHQGGSDCLVFKPDWPPSLQPVHVTLPCILSLLTFSLKFRQHVPQ